jgi:copper resistance protein B
VIQRLINRSVGALLLLPSLVLAYEPAGTPSDWAMPMHRPGPYWKLLADRLEAGFSDKSDAYAWDVQGWYGGDQRRLWVKSEGEGTQGGSAHHAEVQVLYGQMFAPFWDWQIGIRHDFEPDPSRSHLVLGVQGVIPYELEFDGALFVSENGKVSTRVEAEYDLKISQQLVLQPRLELNAAFSDDPAIGIASGLNSTALGLRLRYEVRREFAPYIGIEWEQLYGDTRDFAQDAGEPGSLTLFVIGIRGWF